MKTLSVKPVAIVTGASSGLGWAAALELAKEGYHLCVFARRKDPLEALAAKIGRAGAECLVKVGDVTNPDDVENAVRACLDRWGKVDVLVNNAAIQIYAKFEDYSWEEIQRINDVNYYGYLRFARAVLPTMRRRQQGVILNVLSVMEQGGLQYFSSYTAAKHALMGWSKCLKLELHGSGVQVSNVILPAMNTPLYDHCETKLDVASKPLPPIYSVDIGAKSILHGIRKPSLNHVPVFLQGRLILWSDYFSPWVGNHILNLIGERWQRRKGHKPTPSNAWKSPVTGAGPKGTLKETSALVRYSPLIAIGILGAWFLSRPRKT